VYYPLEHAAYAGWMFPGLFWDKDSEGKGGLRDRKKWLTSNMLSAVSCWAWLWYIVADIVVQTDRCYRLTCAITKLEGKDKGDDTSGSITALRSSLHTHRIMLLREVLFLLPGVHWSLTDWDSKPWLRKGTVDALMWAEAVVGWGNKLAKQHGMI
jgi:hypothetical protein